MKKLFLVFTLCSLSLYSILFCYADVDNKTAHIIDDLPLIAMLEDAKNLEYINEYHMRQQSIISEQCIYLNKLNTIYYLGGFKGNFDGGSLKKCLDWDNTFEEGAPLFKSDTYMRYFSLRTDRILAHYQTSEFFDYAAFIKTGRQEFDHYIKGAVKDEADTWQLNLLMQEKLLDQIVLLEPLKRKGFLEEVLNLGLPVNKSKSLDCLYQLFESRVRLQLLDQMVELNKQKLQKFNNTIGIVITSEKGGKLLLYRKDLKNMENVIQIINVLKVEESYRGLALLNELYNKQNIKLVFEEENGGSFEIEIDSAIQNIAIDENGLVYLDLNRIFTDELQIYENSAPINLTGFEARENQLKQLEQLYSSKTKAVSEIVKELNRYSIYLELKDKKISNIYTKAFEGSQKTWKRNLDMEINAFGIGGVADFIAYIKQFELQDRNPIKLDKERLLIAKFRNSDIQFRTTEESSIWLIEMLIKIRLIK